MSTTQPDDTTEPIHQATPSTKLVRLWLAATLVVGLPLTAYFLAVPDAFGTEGFGGVAGLFVGLLTLVGAGRYGIRWLVLRRTTYTVTDTSVRREYDLLYRTFSRELPLEMLRSVELSRSRTETVLGLGSVRMLTTGANRGMGYLGFDNVDTPEALRGAVRNQRAELRHDDGDHGDDWNTAQNRQGNRQTEGNRRRQRQRDSDADQQRRRDADANQQGRRNADRRQQDPDADHTPRATGDSRDSR